MKRRCLNSKQLGTNGSYTLTFSAQVQLHEVAQVNLSVVVGVNFLHEFSDIVVGYLAVNVLDKSRFDLWEVYCRVRHIALVILVEHAEAFLCLVLAACAREVSVGHWVLQEFEVYAIPFRKVLIVLWELGVLLAARQLVEAEIVQNIAEVLHSDVPSLFLVVEAKRFP